MANSSKLWGEIPPTNPSQEEAVFQSSKPMLVERIQDLAFAEEASKPLYEIHMAQPQASNVDPKFCAMEENVVYTIGLMKYMNYLEDLIEKYKKGTANMLELSEVRIILSQPPIPKIIGDKLPKARKQIKKIDEKTGNSYFRQGKWAPDERPPQIPSHKILMKLLTKSVMTILSHTGFNDTSGSAVSILTEVADDYFNKFLSTLRDNTDNFFTPSTDIGFVDPMEATYQQMGIGSILVVSDYYQTMIVARRIKVKNRIIELYEELKDVYNTAKKSSAHVNVVRFANVKAASNEGVESAADECPEDFRQLHLSSQNAAIGLSLLESLESAARGDSKQS